MASSIDPVFIDLGACALAVILGYAVFGGVGAGPLGRLVATQPRVVNGVPASCGLIAVALGGWATYRPGDFGIGAPEIAGGYQVSTWIAVALATAIGAITRVMAYGDRVRMRRKGGPWRFPAQGIATAGILALVAGLVVCVTWTPGDRIVFWLLVAMSVLFGILMAWRLRLADLPVARAWLIAGAGFAQTACGFVAQDLLWMSIAAAVGGIGMRTGVAMGRSSKRTLVDIIRGREAAMVADASVAAPAGAANP